MRSEAGSHVKGSHYNKKNAMKWVAGEQRLEGSMSEVCFP